MELHVEKLRPCVLTLRFTALVRAPVTLYNCTRALQEDVEGRLLQFIDNGTEDNFKLMI